MFEIDKAVLSTYPGAKMGILIMEGVACSPFHSEVQFAQDLESLQVQYGHLTRKALKAAYPVKAYVDYYKQFGQSYHLLGQLDSVLQGKKSLEHPNPLLQAMFFMELESMLLTAGHDFKQLNFPLQLKLATGTEQYQSISGKEVTTVKGDIMLQDKRGVISSILRGPDSHSQITSDTREVLFTLYAPPGIEAQYLTQTLRKLEKRIQLFSPKARTILLKVFSDV